MSRTAWNFDATANDDDMSCEPDSRWMGALPYGLQSQKKACLKEFCDGTNFGKCALNGNQQRYLSVYGGSEMVPNASTWLCTYAVGKAITPIPASRPVASHTYVLAFGWCADDLDPFTACIIPVYGCMDPESLNFDSIATLPGPASSCVVAFPGCTDSTAQKDRKSVV